MQGTDADYIEKIVMNFRGSFDKILLLTETIATHKLRRGVTMTDEQITAYGASRRMEGRCESTVQKYVGR